MKKLIITIIIWIFTMYFWVVFATWKNNCWVIWNNINDIELQSMLNDCQPDWIIDGTAKKWVKNTAWLVSTKSNAWYEIVNARNKVISIAQKLVILASLLAIWWIVYAGIMLTTAYWDDGKIKKWKDAIKFSIIWFLIAIISQQLVNAIINLIYWVSK